MKKSAIALISILGITATTAIISAVRKAARNKLNSQTSGAQDSWNRHIPHGRHTIVKKRANEALAAHSM